MIKKQFITVLLWKKSFLQKNTAHPCKRGSRQGGGNIYTFLIEARNRLNDCWVMPRYEAMCFKGTSLTI